MFDTGIRQFRMAMGMVWGRKLDTANLARLGARPWFQFAAEHGHAAAANNLGAVLFKEGDLAAALPWFAQASAAGNADDARNNQLVGELSRGGPARTRLARSRGCRRQRRELSVGPAGGQTRGQGGGATVPHRRRSGRARIGG